MQKKTYQYIKTDLVAAKAGEYIPGGAHTYSKGEDQFPANAPKIIDHGLGCKIWDLDGNEFTDLAMSLGTVILGHAHEPIIHAVQKELSRGVNFCKPSKIEAELAELMIDTIPSAEMVKFGKNGSDAVTGAVKLARAYTGRKYVARCESDAFNAIHDWFIGSTVLDRGVPNQVKELTLKFKYNDIKSCEELFEIYPNQIACFLLEPISYTEPVPGFLQDLKDLCERNNALLIFDEVVSGFRFSLGGAEEIANVKPHLSAFGKAMANGFSVSALTGQKEFMKLGGLNHKEERLFLMSTTHGGETHSLAAAIACINEIKKNNVIDHFWQTGKYLMNGVRRIAEEIGANNYITTYGYDVKPAFRFMDENGAESIVARTLFLQETVARGLIMPYVVPSYAHKKDHLDFALLCIRDALLAMKTAAENGGMLKYVNGHIIKPVFRKYN